MEKQVSLTVVAAIGLWVLTFACILSGTTVGVVMGHDYMHVVLSLIGHGLAFSAAAATVTIRQMLRAQNRLLKDAFELGRDATGSQPVRRLH